MKLEMYRSKTGWHWRIRARNGRIVANGGQGYSRRCDIVKVLRRLSGALKGL